MNKVWSIGGTSESVAIALLLAENKIPYVVSVTTATAKALYSANTHIEIGCMNPEQMQSFCERENIKAVVDASHPYAVEVSRQAIAVTSKLNIPYLRYERDNCDSSNTSDRSSIISLDFDELLTGNYLQQQRVLLTVGCKALPQFKPWQDKATLYARVLPKPESLATALAAGFTSDRLITIRPPFSFALEKALWQQWNISLVITKASGKAGGEDIKRQVAADLKIPLIIITRPPIAYPQQTSNLLSILDFCQQQL